MGFEGLKQLYAHKKDYHIVVLALPTKKDKRILKKYDRDDRVTVFWGDLRDYNTVKKAVQYVDIVLHVGALVSPMADHNPKLAWEINYGGTKNIVDAIKERDDRDQVRLLYVGTVAETGNRVAPYHWGRVGDPLVPSPFDYYALSKIAAERYVIESGLKHWVSVRQTAIMHDKLLDVNDGIGYHMPLDNHMEWVTAGDSGRLLFNFCKNSLPDEFWGQVYNIGGGQNCRLWAYDFLDKMYGAMGVDFKKFEDPNYYAQRNFHGQWYFDSDKLNDHLDFRQESVDELMQRIKKKRSFAMRILKYLPTWMVRQIIHKQALKGDTPIRWIHEQNESKINAFFGSTEKWKQIPGWEDFKLRKNPQAKLLDHGYDEKKSNHALSLNDARMAARFRGGNCKSSSMIKGDLQTKLQWQCAHGHDFTASPNLILKTRHWCPTCMKAPWNFDEQAKYNPFLAQVWYADHEKDENRVYA